MRHTYAAFFDSKPRRLGRAMGVQDVIYDDRPGFQLLRNLFAASRILRPNAGQQAVVGIVGLADGFRLIFDHDDWQNRPERLLLHQPHRVIDVG